MNRIRAPRPTGRRAGHHAPVGSLRPHRLAGAPSALATVACNLLDCTRNYTGVGVAYAGGSRYIVQRYVLPRSG